MKRLALQILAVLLTSGAFALDTKGLPGGMGSLLPEKKCIRTITGGVLPTQFDIAVWYLDKPGLVHRIQEEYRRLVSRNGTVDFPILENGDNTYYYINEKNQRTDLAELYRGQTSDSTFELVYHATGKRFFGKYEVLVHLRIIDAGPVGTVYTASVQAYPHNGPMRFLARRFGTVERYFQRYTRIMARVSEKICMGMNDPTFTYSFPRPTLALGQ